MTTIESILSAAARLEVVDVEWTKPLPSTDPTSAPYFQALSKGHLLIEECPSCGRVQHYPRAICVSCGVTPNWKECSGKGTVYSFTIVRQSGVSPFREEVPFVIALIDLAEGPRLMGNITDGDIEDVRVGSNVSAYVQRANEDVGILQWRLVE